MYKQTFIDMGDNNKYLNGTNLMVKDVHYKPLIRALTDIINQKPVGSEAFGE